jgi:hypothetical protein
MLLTFSESILCCFSFDDDSFSHNSSRKQFRKIVVEIIKSQETRFENIPKMNEEAFIGN